MYMDMEMDKESKQKTTYTGRFMVVINAAIVMVALVMIAVVVFIISFRYWGLRLLFIVIRRLCSCCSYQQYYQKGQEGQKRKRDSCSSCSCSSGSRSSIVTGKPRQVSDKLSPVHYLEVLLLSPPPRLLRLWHKDDLILLILVLGQPFF